VGLVGLGQRLLGREEGGGELDGGGDAVARRVVEPGRDVVAGGQIAGDVVAQVLRRGDGEALGAGQPPVGGGQVGGRHAQARVDDGQRVATGPHPAPNVDGLVRRGEHERVLDQLGHQVGQVGGRRSEDGGRFDAADGDPLVVLDLAKRSPDDVGETHRRSPLSRGLDAGQHQQRLGVAAHPGGQVVEPEQVREGVGVGLVGLQLGDEVELAAQQVLVAAAQVDEAVGDVAAQHGLLDGEVERRVLHRVERVRHVRHLVAGVDTDGIDAGHRHVLAQRRVEDPHDHVRQPELGHLLGLLGQRPQRPGDRPRHEPRQDAGRPHHDEGHQPEQQPPRRRPGRQAVGPVGDRLGHLVLVDDVALLVGHLDGGDHLVELHRVGGERVGDRVVGRLGQLGGEVAVGQSPVRARRVAHHLRVAAERLLPHRDLGDFRGRVDAARRQVGGGDRAAQHHRHDLDLAGHGVGQLGALPQLQVVHDQGDAGRGVEERRDDRGVPVEDRLAEGDVGRVPGGGGGVDVGADLLEVVEALHGGRERVLDPLLPTLQLLAELGDGPVGRVP
jgi:hypothetical protein